MANKLFTILVWVILGAVVFGALWLILEPIIWWTEYSELRLYVRSLLILFSLSTFAVLRLYNSIVVNTRFSLKLREAMLKVQTSFSSLERALKNVSSTMGNAKSSMEGLKKSTDNSTEAVKDFTNKLKNKRV